MENNLLFLSTLLIAFLLVVFVYPNLNTIFFAFFVFFLLFFWKWLVLRYVVPIKRLREQSVSAHMLIYSFLFFKL